MRLFRTSDTVLICVMIAAAAATYKVKHDAEVQLAEMKKVQAEIRYERETIDVLRADWSLLSQPARLQKLSEAFADELQLKPVEATQIGTLDELPERPLDIEQILEKVGERTAALPDSTVTGALKP